MNRKNKQGGFLTTIIIIIVALVALKYFFNIDVRDLLKSQIVLEIWNLIKQLFGLIWQVIVNILDFISLVTDKIKNSLTK